MLEFFNGFPKSGDPYADHSNYAEGMSKKMPIKATKSIKIPRHIKHKARPVPGFVPKIASLTTFRVESPISDTI